MKQISIFFTFLALSFNLLAQPTTITWQGKLLDASGNAVTQNNVAMTFAMFDASSAGNQLWPVSGVVAKAVNVVNGLYSVPLGTGIGDDIALTAEMFNGKTPWLEVKVGTETLPRTEITNVPFALISNGLSTSGWENPGEIGKTTPNTGKFTSVETGSLKVANGASEGKVLTSDASGNATWQNTALANFEESNYSYNSKTGVKLQANNATTNVDFVISPKGTGAILTRQPDGTATGGNNRGDNAVDLQTVRIEATQVASGVSSVLVGGATNAITFVSPTLQDGSYSVLVGGRSNELSGSDAVLGGGYDNTLSGWRSFLGGGFSNVVSGTHSVVVGGSGNHATGGLSFIGGGQTNTTGGFGSYVIGGFGNTAQSYSEGVAGTYATTGSGNDQSYVTTDRLFVIGNGTADASRSNALTILKNANTTIGGSLTVNGNGTNTSIAFPTTRGTSGQFLKTDGTGTTLWSGVTRSDVGLGNVENTALSTWAGSANITTVGTIAAGNWNGSTIGITKGGTGAVTKAAGFDALSPMTTAGDVIYGGTAGTGTRLAKGTTGQVLRMNSGATAPEWATPYSGLTNFTESNYTYSSKTGVKFLATNNADNVDFVISPKGTGAILAQQPDGTTSGGDTRGTNAIDLQTLRLSADRVASGENSFIGGGNNNAATGLISTVIGGYNNTASRYLTTVCGGSNNTASLNYATVGGGNGNIASGFVSCVNGGYFNNATADYSTVSGGVGNTAAGKSSFAAGQSNSAQSFGESVFGLNSLTATGSVSTFVATDRIFAVGNGVDENNRSSALTILKNANTTIGGLLTLNGNGTNASITFPAGRGTSGQVLKTDGVGGTAWSGLNKSDVGLGNVENTALSTWAGSTNLTTLGTITAGTWHGTSIAESYIGSLSASKITSGTFDNARINWAAPGTIGSTTPSSGAFTSVSANNGLSVTNGTVTIKPSGSGGTNGQVLTTNGSGDVSWTTPNTGLSNFTESNFTYDSRTGVKFTPNNAATDVDFILQPKGTGAIIAQQPGGTSTGGNKRGDKAVDLQTGRINAAQVASGDYATLVGGRGNTASGNNSISMGLGNISSGDNSTSMGSGTTASGANSIAMGEGATASGNTSVAMGEVTTASGIFTTAMGYNTTAPSGYETVSGSYNTTYSPSSATSWVATDRLFVIGNGTEEGSRSNALTILKNANTTIGGNLTVNGNGTSIAFPATRGTSGQFLKTDGAGATSWSGVTKTDVGLGNVENTAISAWTGSSNITTLGTIATGTWHGTAITESYIGSLSSSKITSGTFDNARINWAAPGTIGSTTPSSGTFTSVSANNGLSVSNGTVNIKPAGSGGTSGQVLTTDGAGNATWQAAATPVTTLNIRFLICVNGLWPGSGSDSHFIGEVVMFAGTESMIPEEFMECKGQSLSAAAYSALFSVIQYTYGGSGTTFKLPDFSSKVPKGL